TCGDACSTANTHGRIQGKLLIDLGHGECIGVGCAAVIHAHEPPACMVRSNAERSQTRSFTSGKGAARYGSTDMSAQSAKLPMCNWQAGHGRSGPCASQLIIIAQLP